MADGAVLDLAPKPAAESPGRRDLAGVAGAALEEVEEATLAVEIGARADQVVVRAEVPAVDWEVARAAEVRVVVRAALLAVVRLAELDKARVAVRPRSRMK